MVIKPFMMNPRMAGKVLKPKKKTKSKAPPGLHMDTVKKVIREKQVLIAQEIKFTKMLAGNDVRVRDKVLRNLREWFMLRANSSFPLERNDFMRIWKGLFYCMWMSDKPLVQEELCENLGSLVHCFRGYQEQVAIQFFGAFLETMSREWTGIDQWRIDKFCMLVRRMTRHILNEMHEREWSVVSLKLFRTEMARSLLRDKTPEGLIMHFTSLYLEEIAKVSDGKIKESTVLALLKPYIIFMSTQTDSKKISYIIQNVFDQLMWQSDLGRSYEEKFEVWREFGFPCGNIDELELVEEKDASDEESNDDNMESVTKREVDKSALDPRAGRVHVFMSEIKFNASKIAEALAKIQFKEFTTTKGRKAIRNVMRKYEEFAKGNFTIGIKSMPLPSTIKLEAPKIADKINELNQFDENLLNDTRAFKKLTKRQRKRLLAVGTEAELGLVETDGITKMEAKQNKRKLTKKTTVTNWLEEDLNVADKSAASVDVTKSASKKNAKTTDKTNAAIKKVASKREATITTDISEKCPKTSSEQKLTNGNATTAPFAIEDEWTKPLADGEQEYFVPSRKIRLQEANNEHVAATVNSVASPKTTASPTDGGETKNNTVLNPFAKKKGTKVQKLRGKKEMNQSLPTTPFMSTEKRVKIMLEKNRSQDTYEYLRQVRNSPQVPFDSATKPQKSLLKPNLMPSPINPFYKKTLDFLN